MHCPQCGMDQPAGVTICGFCGASVVAAPPRHLAVPAAPGARSARARARRGRWLPLLLLAGAAVGLFWSRPRAARPPPAPEQPSSSRAASPQDVPRSSAPAPRRLPALVEGRLTETWLSALAAELELRAESGDVEGLAALLDPRVRFRSTIDDGREVRRLDAGLPELLAHWLAAWLAGEASGLSIQESVELREIAAAADGRSGRISRRLEPATDPSRVRFPARLLGDLAQRRELDASALEAVDFTVLEGVSCGVDESLRVGATARGFRVVSVERVGRCAPAAR